MIFWVLQWLRFHLITVEPDPQDIAKALEFQYQQQIQALQLENAKLQNELASKKVCPKVENKKTDVVESTARERKVYREALKDIQNENYNEAIVSMETFVRNFPKSDLADHAIYWMAQIYLQKGETDLARAELERLIRDYPHGRRVKRAKTRLKELARTPAGESILMKDPMNKDSKLTLAEGVHP